MEEADASSSSVAYCRTRARGDRSPDALTYDGSDAGTHTGPYRRPDAGAHSSPYRRPDTGTHTGPYRRPDAGTHSGPYHRADASTHSGPGAGPDTGRLRHRLYGYRR